MAYLGTTINNSPTIAGTLGADMVGDLSFLAMKFDGTGAVVKCGAGEAAIGIVLPGHGNDLKKGDEVTIQIKDIGIAKAGAAIAKGAPVSTDADGKMITAVATKYVVGYALTGASAKDAAFSIQITKSGVMA